jgi:hypothetical protein
MLNPRRAIKQLLAELKNGAYSFVERERKLSLLKFVKDQRAAETVRLPASLMRLVIAPLCYINPRETVLYGEYVYVFWP